MFDAGDDDDHDNERKQATKLLDQSIRWISHSIHATMDFRSSFADKCRQTVFVGHGLFNIFFEISKKWKPNSHSFLITLKISSIVGKTKRKREDEMEKRYSSFPCLTYDSK